MDHIHINRLGSVQENVVKQAQPTKKQKPKILNGEAYNAQFHKRDFASLRDNVFAALPVPPFVIPIVASQKQVLEYEKLMCFSNKNLTIEKLLEPYSIVKGKIEKDRFVKILFLRKLITKLTNQDLNYDMAIICNGRATENFIHDQLSSSKFNICKISSLPETQNLSGVVVKVRKNVKEPSQFTPFERKEVDALFIYDSACHTNVEVEYQVFKGVRKERPALFYLCAMDTAEIRIHTYNRFVSKDEKAIGWDTKVNELDRDLKQVLLLQPNREPDNVFYCGWNDYLSQGIFNWLSSKDSDFFEFKFPTKGTLKTQVTSFIIHHPIKPLPVYNPTPTLSAPKKQPLVGPKPAQTASSATQQLVTTTAARAVVENPRSSKLTIRPDTLPLCPFIQPAVIHPERMALMNSQSSEPMALDETRKRQSSPAKSPPSTKLRKTDEPESPSPADEPLLTQPIVTQVVTPVEFVSPPVHADLPPVHPVSPTSTEAATTTTTTSTKVDDPPQQPRQSIVDEITHDFDDFLAKALKKFQDDISSIKF